MPNTIRIAGRHFRAADRTTLRHDLATQGQVSRAGAGILEIQVGESMESFAERMSKEAAASPAMVRLLSHVLVPADCCRWTPAVTDEVAGYLTACADGDELAPHMAAMLEGLVSSGASVVVQRMGVSARD